MKHAALLFYCHDTWSPRWGWMGLWTTWFSRRCLWPWHILCQAWEWLWETLCQQSSKARIQIISKRFSFSRAQTLNKNWSSACSGNLLCHDKCPWLSWAIKFWQGGFAKVWELCGHLFVSHFYRLSLQVNHKTHQLERLSSLAIIAFNLICIRGFLNCSEFLQVKQLCVQFRGSVLSPASLQCGTEGKWDKRACSNIQVVMNRRKLLGSCLWFSMSSLIQTGKERNLKGQPVLLLYCPMSLELCYCLHVL